MTSQITIQHALSEQQINEVSDFAICVWHEYFPFLLSDQQIDYMCDLFNTPSVMMDNITNHHYQYYGVYHQDTMIGYIALQDHPSYLFLSKLYLSAAAIGQGHARAMMDFVIEEAKSRGYHSIQLTCNKYNQHSLDVYHHYGFTIIDADQTDIGNGFIMDDYIMEKVIQP